MCAASAAWVLLAGALSVAGAAQERRTPAHDADSAQALFLLGQSRERTNDLAGAADAYERALQRHPELAAAHDRLGYVRGQLGQTDAALAHFSRAVALDPSLSTARTSSQATGPRSTSTSRH
jgi:tetratricopeptide (TPR) repeat protein